MQASPRLIRSDDVLPEISLLTHVISVLSLTPMVRNNKRRSRRARGKATAAKLRGASTFRVRQDFVCTTDQQRCCCRHYCSAAVDDERKSTHS